MTRLDPSLEPFQRPSSPSQISTLLARVCASCVRKRHDAMYSVLEVLHAREGAIKQPSHSTVTSDHTSGANPETLKVCSHRAVGSARSSGGDVRSLQKPQGLSRISRPGCTFPGLGPLRHRSCSRQDSGFPLPVPTAPCQHRQHHASNTEGERVGGARHQRASAGRACSSSFLSRHKARSHVTSRLVPGLRRKPPQGFQPSDSEAAESWVPTWRSLATSSPSDSRGTPWSPSFADRQRSWGSPC